MGGHICTPWLVALCQMTLLRRLLDPIIDVGRILPGMGAYVRYVADWRAYASMEHAESLRLRDAYPCLYDDTASTSVDPHYFYQDIWAFKAIQRSGAPSHIDVGSRAILVGMLSAVTRVTFVDIRPLLVALDNFESKKGSLLELPFGDGSVASLSCLHVAEHVGLGRYGDSLDPEGTRKAAREMSRVLRRGGNLYISVPIGRPRVCFNAHRIHAPQQIIEYFGDLELVSFAAVDDGGGFSPRADPADFTDASYACGMFHFVAV